MQHVLQLQHPMHRRGRKDQKVIPERVVMPGRGMMPKRVAILERMLVIAGGLI
jgi:hypothetical protein